VPSSEDETITLPVCVNVTPVTAAECWVKVTKQNPSDIFHTFT